MRGWRAQGLPGRIDPETKELLIAEPDLLEWWRRMNRHNYRLQRRVRANLHLHAPDGSPLRWPRDEQRPMSTLVVEAPQAWVSWEAAAELASGGGDVDVSVEVLRLAHRWLSRAGGMHARPRVLLGEPPLVWAPDAALAGAMLPEWALTLEGWVQTGLATLEVQDDELLAIRPSRAPAWVLEVQRR